MSPDDAPSRDPLHEIRDALAPSSIEFGGGLIRLDLNREVRTGVPEVVQARGKDADTLVAIIETFLSQNGRAILSLVRPAMVREIRNRFVADLVDEHARARMVVVKRPGFPASRTGGRVGIVTAGTSDAPVAEQARVMAEEMGCETSMVYDVGVAGLHRLIAPLHRMIEDDVDAIVVAAGMDGALPSVVAGLVGIPVVGVPTSTGYGMGGRGDAALLSMLQTCAPGLTVVNIDNGIGAGASAARIANRMAAARRAVEVASYRGAGHA
jgi:NCAIR mutase (PurE)-related protein